MNKLKLNQVCPLHRSRTCSCHPEPVVKFQRERKIKSFGGIKKFPDGREVCSPAELRDRKNYMMQHFPYCLACGDKFTDYNEIELAHRKSKGNGGFKRDDRVSNLYLMHKFGNRAQGSRTLEQYISDCLEKGVKPCQQ